MDRLLLLLYISRFRVHRNCEKRILHPLVLEAKHPHPRPLSVLSAPAPCSPPLAAFDTCGVEGQVLFSSPIVVEWRFSFPAPLPMADETAAGGALSGARGEKTTPTANRQGAAAFSPAPASERLTALTRDGVVIATPPRRGWLRRRLSAIGGGGGVGGRADNDNGGVVERRSRVAVDGLGTEGDRRGNRLPADRGVHYVAVVLPVAPKRTKIFARCVCTSGLDGSGEVFCLMRVQFLQNFIVFCLIRFGRRRKSQQHIFLTQYGVRLSELTKPVVPAFSHIYNACCVCAVTHTVTYCLFSSHRYWTPVYTS